MSTCRFPNRIAEFKGSKMLVLCSSFKELGQPQSSPETIISRHFSRDRLKSFFRPQPLRRDPLISFIVSSEKSPQPPSPDIIPSISFQTSIENPTQTNPDMFQTSIENPTQTNPDMISPMPTGRTKTQRPKGPVARAKLLASVCRTLISCSIVICSI